MSSVPSHDIMCAPTHHVHVWIPNFSTHMYDIPFTWGSSRELSSILSEPKWDHHYYLPNTTQQMYALVTCDREFKR